MAVISVQAFSVAGLTPNFVAASAGGDTFDNAGANYLFVKNQSASSITVTVDSVQQCSHGFDHDQVVTVTAGQTKQIGLFPTTRYNNASGQVAVSYSAVASVTVAVVNSDL